MNERGATPLAMLLWVDQQYAGPSTLTGCLGDSYLYAMNPVFRVIRDAALDLDVRFHGQEDSLGRAYGIAPLFTLNEILKEGVVPYRADVDLLNGLVETNPHLKLDAQEVRSFMAGHKVLHESAHVVADRHLRAWTPESEAADLAPCLRSLIGESFANTVECIGGLLASQGTHQVLWSWNSYILVCEPQRALLEACAETFGTARMFELAMWIFFHLNVHANTNECAAGFREAAVRSIFSDGGYTPGELRIAASVGPALFGLSEGFRGGTTPLYFRLLGLEEGLEQIRKLDLGSAKVLETINFAAAIKRLSSLVAGGLPECKRVIAVEETVVGQ